MDILRSPGGCPWDREQTHDSLKKYLIEEAYEVIEAIEAGARNYIIKPFEPQKVLDVVSSVLTA